jgi:response regulator RpfG family c-di-GMP phosphodiesterase
MDHTLLYIDPDPATRLLVKKALESEGLVVLAARTALEGQQSAFDVRLDFALVDVDRVRAAELVPALRRSPGLEQARLVASTAHVWPEHVEKMLALGFDRVLLQPFDIDTLAQDLSALLPPAAPGEAPAPTHAPVVDETSEHEVATGVEAAEAPESPVSEAGPDEAVPASVAEPAGHGEATGPELSPVPVPLLWRVSLTPLTANLVRSTASAEGLVAVLDDDERALVVVAAVSSRHAAGAIDTPIGARVLARLASWTHGALYNRDAIILPADGLPPSPLVPPGCHTLLILPVASRDNVYGIAIVGKHRSSRLPPFGPGKVARSRSQAEQIAAVVEMARELDRAAGQRRREMEQLRLATLRGVLTELTTRARPSRRNGAGKERTRSDNGWEGADQDRTIRLGLALAERLGLPAAEKETLRQALLVQDIGKAWVEHALFPRATFSVGGRERLLDGYAEQGAEILGALDWPSAVVDLVRIHQAHWDGTGQPPGLSGTDIPLPARIMAVVGAFATLTTAPPGAGVAPDVHDALAELSRQAGHRYDPEVVDALIELCLAVEEAPLDRG